MVRTLVRTVQQASKHLKLAARLRGIIARVLGLQDVLPDLHSGFGNKDRVHHVLHCHAAQCTPEASVELCRALLCGLGNCAESMNSKDRKKCKTATLVPFVCDSDIMQPTSCALISRLSRE